MKRTKIESFLRERKVWTKFKENYRKCNPHRNDVTPSAFAKYLKEHGDVPGGLTGAFVWPKSEFALWNGLDDAYEKTFE